MPPVPGRLGLRPPAYPLGRRRVPIEERPATARHTRRALDEETQLPIRGGSDADTSAASDVAILEDPPWCEDKRRPAKVVAVEGPGDTERFRDSAGACRQGVAARAPGDHQRFALEWLDAPNQDGLRIAHVSCHHVHAPVHPVDPVDVGSTGRPEHRAIALGGPASRRRVGRRIPDALVRFGLYDHAARRVAVDGRHELRAEERPRHLGDRSAEEIFGEGPCRRYAGMPGPRGVSTRPCRTGQDSLRPRGPRRRGRRPRSLGRPSPPSPPFPPVIARALRRS